MKTKSPTESSVWEIILGTQADLLGYNLSFHKLTLQGIREPAETYWVGRIGCVGKDYGLKNNAEE